MKPNISRAILIGPFLLLALLVTACGNPGAATVTRDGPSAPARMSLTDLHDVADLHARFNQDAGRLRLVLLVSPT